MKMLIYLQHNEKRHWLYRILLITKSITRDDLGQERNCTLVYWCSNLVELSKKQDMVRQQDSIVWYKCIHGHANQFSFKLLTIGNMMKLKIKWLVWYLKSKTVQLYSLWVTYPQPISDLLPELINVLKELKP